MKKLIIILAVLASACFAADEKAPPVMPEEVTLTTGRVLRKVQVIRWETNRVVLKHSAGADPIPFSLIKSISADDLKALRLAGAADAKRADAERKTIAAEQAKIAELDQQLEAAKKEHEEACEKASRNGTLMTGQTMDQVRRVLGDWRKINKYDSGREQQVIYDSPGRDTYYVYFTDGKVTSWQSQDRR